MRRLCSCQANNTLKEMGIFFFFFLSFFLLVLNCSVWGLILFIFMLPVAELFLHTTLLSKRLRVLIPYFLIISSQSSPSVYDALNLSFLDFGHVLVKRSERALQPIEKVEVEGVKLSRQATDAEGKPG